MLDGVFIRSSSMGYSRYWKARSSSPWSRQRSPRAAASHATGAASADPDAARVQPQIGRVINDVPQAFVAIV